MLLGTAISDWEAAVSTDRADMYSIEQALVKINIMPNPQTPFVTNKTITKSIWWRTSWVGLELGQKSLGCRILFIRMLDCRHPLRLAHCQSITLHRRGPR
jgi:hypothetical protein